MIHKLLNEKKLVLASASPRRFNLLKMLGLSPLVIPAQVDEPITSERPYIQVMKHATNKARTVAALMDEHSMVVGADTIVVVGNRILGKPQTLDDARNHLRLLSGVSHKVYTGLCICWRKQCECRFERSQVEFATLTPTEIEEYLITREPMDKAGAYGIQGYGSQFIRQIRGCYFNVMGFPINLFYRMLKDMHENNTLT